MQRNEQLHDPYPFSQWQHHVLYLLLYPKGYVLILLPVNNNTDSLLNRKAFFIPFSFTFYVPVAFYNVFHVLLQP
ncbi:hypothetical protein B0I18_10238 [Taibaiella chishuiensis]|uniref:Uncharacterized protein n=1 Tax=Taibaiella chishuiensis TaxID=1434707 RepID=A0A2P8D792_9BACT|nr:hypothetical protein B0I18_10238 [Taibaiella chishuiensis]